MKLSLIDKTDYPEIMKIYAEGINTGMATFETKVPDWKSWDSKNLSFGRIKAIGDEEIMGWATLSPVSTREVYGGVAEVSIYIASAFRRQGVGSFLLRHLVNISEDNGCWSLQAGIFRENEASIALHRKCGFREIGYKEKIGCLNGTWHDNIIMERRSKIVGI